MRTVLDVACQVVFWAWYVPNTLWLWDLDFDWLRRFARLLCVPCFVALVAEVFLSPPAILDWPFVAFCFGYWYLLHRKLHKDGHGRRLLETARGWVRRRGNRLVVIPEVAR